MPKKHTLSYLYLRMTVARFQESDILHGKTRYISGNLPLHRMPCHSLFILPYLHLNCKVFYKKRAKNISQTFPPFPVCAYAFSQHIFFRYNIMFYPGFRNYILYFTVVFQLFSQVHLLHPHYYQHP